MTNHLLPQIFLAFLLTITGLGILSFSVIGVQDPEELSWQMGYIVSDFEFIGFWNCNGDEPVGFVDRSNKKLSESYNSIKLSDYEPVYIEALARVVDDANSRRLGSFFMYRKVLEIRDFKNIERTPEVNCGSKIDGFRVGEDTFF